ncbi:hypothetical protein C3L56_01185 [Veillonellaceae bacterium M2-4]|nr:hypothetical protein [Veillonellaceae bacterium M2-4]
MQRLQWLKIDIGIMDDPRMMYMLEQKRGAELFTFWIYLRALAGKVNDHGRISVTGSVPVAMKTFAMRLRKKTAFIMEALALFESLELISRDENGVITLLVWDEIQGVTVSKRDVSRSRAVSGQQATTIVTAKTPVTKTPVTPPVAAATKAVTGATAATKAAAPTKTALRKMSPHDTYPFTQAKGEVKTMVAACRQTLAENFTLVPESIPAPQRTSPKPRIYMPFTEADYIKRCVDDITEEERSTYGIEIHHAYQAYCKEVQKKSRWFTRMRRGDERLETFISATPLWAASTIKRKETG